MVSVAKMLWVIETHFARDLSLEAIAQACGVSRFHMGRSFAAATGMPVMVYVRGRRLTEGARLLAAGAPGVLDVALSVGYGSHEAFTRAFRDWFGLTPDDVRRGGAIDPTLLVEPIRMDTHSSDIDPLAPPRRESRPAFSVVGLAQTYRHDAVGGIPAQWTAFQEWEGTLGERPGAFFGVCDRYDEEKGQFRYLCGVEVDDARDVPRELTVVTLPARRYLAFTHAGHVSEIRQTMQAIWGRYIPEHGTSVDPEVPMFEYYDTRFDARTGRGGFEIWLPLSPEGDV